VYRSAAETRSSNNSYYSSNSICTSSNYYLHPTNS